MIKLGLANVKAAAAILGNPQDSFKSVHIAGTNGKGSVCTWLELMFLSSGRIVTTGKYISPHLVNVTERISVNGENISQNDFDNLWTELYGGSYDTNAYQSEIANSEARLYGQSLTEFEKLTISAFEHFKRSGVTLAIIEVGLGGRLDATNILSPEQTLATAITNIGLDHQEYLGTTLEQISKEKHGIVKPSVPHYEGMLTAEQPNGELGSNYLLAKQIYVDLIERHYNESANDAVTRLNYKNLREAFNKRYKARFDESEAGVIVDGAHNPDGASELNRYLRNKYQNQSKIWIIGMLDKDHDCFLHNLFSKLLKPEQDTLIFSRVNHSRSKDPAKLKEYILQQYPELKTYSCEQLEEALVKARHCERSEAIPPLRVITGSLYLCGEYLSLQN